MCDPRNYSISKQEKEMKKTLGYQDPVKVEGEKPRYSVAFLSSSTLQEKCRKLSDFPFANLADEPRKIFINGLLASEKKVQEEYLKKQAGLDVKNLVLIGAHIAAKLAQKHVNSSTASEDVTLGILRSILVSASQKNLAPQLKR